MAVGKNRGAEGVSGPKTDLACHAAREDRAIRRWHEREKRADAIFQRFRGSKLPITRDDVLRFHFFYISCPWVARLSPNAMRKGGYCAKTIRRFCGFNSRRGVRVLMQAKTR